MPRKKKTTNKRPVLDVPSLLTNEAFALREARLAAVRDQINQKVCPQGLCVLCLQEARLTRSHLSSNSLLRGYYGHTWESVFLWHGEHRSSTDAFSYLLFCTPCEQRFMEDDVIAYLGQKLGLSTDGCPDVPNEACIWHWAFTLFMRQLAVCEDRGAHAWAETIYRRSVHFALLCKGNGNAHRELDNLPAIVVALSQPDQDLWQELELEHRKLLDERASRRQAGWLMLNVEARKERFCIHADYMEYHLGDLHVYLRNEHLPSDTCGVQRLGPKALDSWKPHILKGFPKAVIKTVWKQWQASTPKDITAAIKAKPQVKDVDTKVKQWWLQDMNYVEKRLKAPDFKKRCERWIQSNGGWEALLQYATYEPRQGSRVMEGASIELTG